MPKQKKEKSRKSKKSVSNKSVSKKSVSKKSVSKKSVSKKKVEIKVEPVEDQPVEVKPVEVKLVEVEMVEVKPEVKPVEYTQESLDEYFKSLVSTIDEHLKSKKDISKKFIRSIKREIKIIQKHAKKTIKSKKKNKKIVKKNMANSGFLKPVKLSPKLFKFTGWDDTKLYTRVDVTKCICAYIKDNDLQFPKDRRIILPDKKLLKILKYDPDRDGDLTYFKIQSFIKHNFLKE